MAYNNNRIFYACQAVAIVPETGNSLQTDGIGVRGLQSVGMSSTFNLEQVFEMGQIEIYENIEEVADIEVTLTKAIDGRALIYQLTSAGNCQTSLAAAAKNRCDVYLAIFTDAADSVSGGTKLNLCWNSGMYTSAVAYNYSIDGSATEEVTLVGNDRFWDGVDGGAGTSTFYDNPFRPFNDADTPLSGVQRRTDLDLTNSIFPSEVRSQQLKTNSSSNNGLHLQSISVSTDFAQDNILELGRFGPYARYATFPIEVTSEFEVIATSGDLVSVSGTARNLGAGQQIKIVDNAGTVIDLGNNNKLSSVSYSGGDTGGGNATITYSYNTYNSLLVNGGNAATQNNTTAAGNTAFERTTP